MDVFRCTFRRATLGALTLIATAGYGANANAPSAYTPITPSMADRTVTLTGHDLTIEQIVAVARYGAKVALSPEARQRESDNYGLLLEAAAAVLPRNSVSRVGALMMCS